MRRLRGRQDLHLQEVPGLQRLLGRQDEDGGRPHLHLQEVPSLQRLRGRQDLHLQEVPGLRHQDSSFKGRGQMKVGFRHQDSIQGRSTCRPHQLLPRERFLEHQRNSINYSNNRK